MPSLTKITIDNYQSLAHAELDAADLTVLVGPGRSGKSAVIRALCSLLLNENGDSFIRHGEKQASVHLSFSDGTTILWMKERGKSSTYTLNGRQPGGRTFTKTGTQVPEEIGAYLGIGEIEVEQGFSLTPQLKDQFSSVFILSESGSRQARILGKITKLDAVVTAQMACRKQGDHSKRDAASTEKELESLREQREALPDVAALEQELDDINELLALVGDARRMAGTLRELVATNDHCRKQLSVKADGVKEKVDQARLLLEQVSGLETVLGEHTLAKYNMKIAREKSGRFQTENEKAQVEYDAACKDASICDHCPWR